MLRAAIPYGRRVWESIVSFSAWIALSILSVPLLHTFDEMLVLRLVHDLCQQECDGFAPGFFHSDCERTQWMPELLAIDESMIELRGTHWFFDLHLSDK